MALFFLNHFINEYELLKHSKDKLNLDTMQVIMFGFKFKTFLEVRIVNR